MMPGSIADCARVGVPAVLLIALYIYMLAPILSPLLIKPARAILAYLAVICDRPLLVARLLEHLQARQPIPAY